MNFLIYEEAIRGAERSRLEVVKCIQYNQPDSAYRWVMVLTKYIRLAQYERAKIERELKP